MATRVSMRQKRKAAPKWIFPWRRAAEPRLTGWLALAAAGTAFAFLFTSMRIRVTPPMPWASQKASFIHVLDDTDGRALTLRAKEGGPFPSRFEPSEWLSAHAPEISSLNIPQWTAPTYTPSLSDLPDTTSTSPRLAPGGTSVFPKRVKPAGQSPAAVALKTAPMLLPLSGITAAEMPDPLPAFDGEVVDAKTSDAPRFLLNLDANGNVLDCVNLTGGDEAGPSPIEIWLRGVSFRLKPGSSKRWISIGVGFINRPTDGPDAR